jgi:hypothetical protein
MITDLHRHGRNEYNYLNNCGEKEQPGSEYVSLILKLSSKPHLQL